MSAPPIVIPGVGGGHTGDTLLILGALGVGGWLLWRKGVFDKPAPVETPSSSPAPALRAAKPRPVLARPTPTSSALATAPVVQTVTQATELVKQGNPSVLTSDTFAPLLVKPPPIGSSPGVVATARPVNAPSPFGKKPTFVVRAAPAAAPPPVSIAPALAPKPAPVLTTNSLTTKQPITFAGTATIKPLATSLAKPLAKPAAKPFPIMGAIRR